MELATDKPTSYGYSLACGSTPPSHTDRKPVKVKKKKGGGAQFLFYSIGCSRLIILSGVVEVLK